MEKEVFGLEGNMYESLLESLKYLYDNVAEVSLQKEQAVIVYSARENSIIGQKFPYNKFIRKICEYIIYDADADEFIENMAFDRLIRLSVAGKCERFELRCRKDGNLPFVWEKINLVPVGKDTVMVYFQNIDLEKRWRIIKQTVIGEYDFIMYINAKRDTYYAYSNSNEEISIPKQLEHTYSRDIVKLARSDAMEREEGQRLLLELSLDNIRNELADKDELIFYTEMVQNGHVRNKKIRVVRDEYANDRYILTRSDMTMVQNSQRQSREEVSEAMRQLDAANTAQNEFLTKLSSDVREPISSIIGMSALALEHTDDGDYTKETLSKISDESRKLLKQINQIVEISNMKKLKVDKKFNVGSVIRNIMESVRVPIEQRNITLMAHVQDIHHEEVYGDREALEHAFKSVLATLVNEAREDSVIQFMIREKGVRLSGYGYYEIQIEDSDGHIDIELLDDSFRPFIECEGIFQNTYHTTENDIGYTLEREGITRMQGNIRVEDRADGGIDIIAGFYLRLDEEDKIVPEIYHGSRILLLASEREEKMCRNNLEMLKLIVESAGSLGEMDMRIKSHKNWKKRYLAIFVSEDFSRDIQGTYDHLSIRFQNELPPIVWIDQHDIVDERRVFNIGYNEIIRSSISMDAGKRLLSRLSSRKESMAYNYLEPLRNLELEEYKILLGESEKLHGEVIREMLELAGANVVVTETGDLVLEELKEGNFDLVILGNTLKDNDMYETAGAIRFMGDRRKASIPVLALISDMRLEEILRIRQAGMNEYLLKPIIVSEFADKLKHWLCV